MAIPSSYWTWNAISSYAWRNTDSHINVLEFARYLDYLRSRSIAPSLHVTRFLVLIDSQVAFGSPC